MQLARRTTVALAVAAFVPLLLLGCLQIASSLSQMRQEAEYRTLSRASAFIARIDGELMGDLGALTVLAGSRFLETRDWGGARARALGVVSDFPHWRNVLLADGATGRLIWSTAGEGAPEVLTAARAFAQTGRANQIAGFAEATSSSGLIALHRRVALDGNVYVITVERDVSDFQAQLLSVIDAGEVAALVDRDGLFIARTTDYPERRATPATQYVRDAVARGGHGLYSGVTYEGLRNRTAYATSDLSGWSAHIAVPAASYTLLGAGSLGFAVLAILVALAFAGAITLYAVRDLTEKRRLERAGFQTQKLTAIGQMSGAVAHDFNNLLAILIGCLRMLQRTEDADKRKKLIDEGLAAADRGAKLIAQLLSFARDKPIELETVDLGRALSGIRDLIVRTLGPGNTLDIAIAESARFVRTNAAQLELVVLNLAVNARDAMPDGGSFSIISKPSNVRGYVDIVVRDTGIGMNDEVAARALEPFFTTKEDGKGTGLGLAQAHLLMEQSGGTLLLETAPGEGAVFTLRLPAGSPHAAS